MWRGDTCSGEKKITIENKLFSRDHRQRRVQGFVLFVKQETTHGLGTLPALSLHKDCCISWVEASSIGLSWAPAVWSTSHPSCNTFFQPKQRQQKWTWSREYFEASYAPPPNPMQNVSYIKPVPRKRFSLGDCSGTWWRLMRTEASREQGIWHRVEQHQQGKKARSNGLCVLAQTHFCISHLKCQDCPLACMWLRHSSAHLSLEYYSS